MTVELVKSYTPEQHAQGKACVQRYGTLAAARIIADLWNPAPHLDTLRRWGEDSTIIVERRHVALWEEHDRSVTNAMKSRFGKTLDKMVDVIEKQLDADDDHPERLKLVQPLAISAGIFFDKVAGLTRNGMPAGINVAPGASMTLNVFPPGERSVLPLGAEEPPAIEGEYREVEQ